MTRKSYQQRLYDDNKDIGLCYVSVDNGEAALITPSYIEQACIDINGVIVPIYFGEPSIINSIPKKESPKIVQINIEDHKLHNAGPISLYAHMDDDSQIILK